MATGRRLESPHTKGINFIAARRQAQSDFVFLDPAPLVDGDLSLVISSTGFKGPEDDLFPYYRFHMVHTGTGETMGGITLRIGDAAGVLKYPGHVGFDVAPAHRGHRYAARATMLLFDLAKAHGLAELWIGCAENNEASRKTCERLGGQLIEIVTVPPEIDLHVQGLRTACRYRVPIAPNVSADAV